MIEVVPSRSFLILEDGSVHKGGCSDHSLVDAGVVHGEVDGLIFGEFERGAGPVRVCRVLADVEPQFILITAGRAIDHKCETYLILSGIALIPYIALQIRFSCFVKRAQPCSGQQRSNVGSDESIGLRRKSYFRACWALSNYQSSYLR